MIARSERDRKLTGIESGRGIAALLVVGVHASSHVTQAYGWPAFGNLFAFGHAGVDFFFVLSGFIIYHIHQNDIGQPTQLPHYLQRRFTRIYPFYWIVLAAALAARSMSTHEMPLPSVIITSIALAPLPGALVVDIAWTLQHEITFYSVFSLLILNRHLGRILLLTWLVAILVCAFVIGGEHLGWPAHQFASYFDLEFFLGMGAAWLLARHKVPAPRLVLLVGVFGFLAIGLAEDMQVVIGPDKLTHVGYGLTGMSIVLGLVEAERSNRLVVPRVCIVLGGASYALYLTHLLSIGAAWQALLAMGLAPVIPASVTFLMLVSAAGIGGIALSYVVEKPTIVLARRLISATATGFAARVRLT